MLAKKICTYDIYMSWQLCNVGFAMYICIFYDAGILTLAMYVAICINEFKF